MGTGLDRFWKLKGLSIKKQHMRQTKLTMDEEKKEEGEDEAEESESEGDEELWVLKYGRLAPSAPTPVLVEVAEGENKLAEHRP